MTVHDDENRLQGVLRSILEDSEGGSLLPLTEYVARSPGDVKDIASRYLAAERLREAASSGSPRIGRYRLVEEIGRGGQAVVWRAEDDALGRTVALKVIRALGAAPRETVERFRREAAITSKLEHPAICPVYEVGFDDVPWIAMRHVEGETLAARIATARTALENESSSARFVTLGPGRAAGRAVLGPAPPTPGSRPAPSSVRDMMTTVAVIEEAARALHAAHEVGVVHRDVKPGNIMVTKDGKPVIVDFGLARDEDGDAPTLTVTGDLMGTPAYMSPEQLTRQAIRVDRRTDVYSLGVTLFECLTVRRPFEGPTREALYTAILNEEAPDVRRLNGTVPGDLAVVVETALQKGVVHRYQTALELAEDLRRVREHQPIAARPVGRWTRTARWAQRNPVVAAMLAIVLVVLSVSTGVFAWQRDQVATKNTELSETNAKLEAANESLEQRGAELQDALGEVTAEKERVTRLKDGRTLRELLARAETLFPSHPENIPRFEAWLKDAQSLLDNLPLHRETLAALETTAGPYTDEQRQVDHPEVWAALVATCERAAELEARINDAETEIAERRLESALTEAEDACDALAAQMEVRRSWGFDTEEAWLHELLVDLVAGFSALESPDGVVADVRGRLETAHSVRARTIDDHALAWKEARARLLTGERYGKLDMPEQLGVIPLGSNPATGLEEFLHWESHARGAPLPTRDANGRLQITEETGLVFVLIPGGTFRMGAERPATPDGRGSNLDPDARPDESPVHDVTLAPYFISKYEMTQAQWSRVMKAEPSTYGPGTNIDGKVTTLVHPVEQVSWEDCREAMVRLGLVLPTEAQWECAARGGRGTIWPHGDEKAVIEEHGNLADASLEANGFPASAYDKDLNDGRTIHAPVGTYLPNGFGLFDVAGNVREWCRDLYGSFELPAAPDDGVRPGDSGSRSRVFRGGSFIDTPVCARVAYRLGTTPESRAYVFGCRPSRVITF